MFNLKTVPTIYQPGVVPNEIYSGVPSFMGMPTAKTVEELKQYDFAVMGVPFEGGCTYGGFSSSGFCDGIYVCYTHKGSDGEIDFAFVIFIDE